MLRADQRITPVVGARILVGKFNWATLADEIIAQSLADFSCGAGITVVTPRTFRFVGDDAAILIGIAGFVRERVAKNIGDTGIIAGRAILVLGLVDTVSIAGIAGIDRADFTIVTGNRLANTNAILARKSRRTRIRSVARSARKGQMGATLRTVADILGAVVVIIAQVDEIAAILGGFINETVAVIIQTIARFRFGGGSITVGQSAFHAHPFAAAGPFGGSDVARRPKTELDGFVGAFTGVGGGDALLQLNAVHGQCRLTIETRRTAFPALAGTTAEVTFPGVSKTGIIRPAEVGAITGNRTGNAQVGKV